MFDTLIQVLAPHLCSGCGFYGLLLCHSCKYDITYDAFERCLECEKLNQNGICLEHKTAYLKAWCISERRDALERLINQLKFERVRAAANVLAELLNSSLPVLPASTLIVPIPTSRRHVRARGYDHMSLIAKRLSRLRSLTVASVLRRQHEFSQKGADEKLRSMQAKHAFTVLSPLSKDCAYLLLDDVVTTGATIRYAAEALQRAGAEIIWVATISHEPLD